MSFLKPRRELTARQTSPAVRFNTCGGYLRDPTGHLCPNHKLRRFWTSKRMLILLRSSIWIRGYCPYAWGPYWSDKQNTMWRYEKARKLCYKRPHAVVVRQSRAGLDHQTKRSIQTLQWPCSYWCWAMPGMGQPNTRKELRFFIASQLFAQWPTYFT